MHITQELIVFVASALLFALLSALVAGFLTLENLLGLVRNVAVLGIFGVGMGLVVIARGVDLSLMANMVISVGLALVLHQAGLSFALSIVLGLMFALLSGALTGFLIAYAELPAIFVTLAMGAVIFGFGHSYFYTIDNLNAPDTAWFDFLGRGRVLGIPAPIAIFAAVALSGHLLLSRTRIGAFIRYTGDNPAAAKITGMPVRLLTVGLYMASAFTAFIGGLVLTSSTHTLDARLYSSTIIYDVLLVVVIGGIGLSGGKGGIRNVLVGTLFVGLMLNGMTLLDVPFVPQNLIKSLVLLGALVIDGILNPIDEQTSQQGDI